MITNNARRALGTWLGALACLLVASSVQAGTPDSLSAILQRPAGSSVVGVASIHGGQGLMYSRDGGETFTALCSATAGSPGIDSNGNDVTWHPAGFDPAVITHDGYVLVADSRGIWSDDGHGCGWRRLPDLIDTVIGPMILDPADETTVFGITATGGGVDNGLFRRSSEGVIERVGPQEPILFYSLVAAKLPEGGRRIYTNAVTRQQPILIADGGDDFELVEIPDSGVPIAGTQLRPFNVVRYSDDGGENWTSHEHGPFLSGSLRIDAVDPTNPDRLIASLRRFANPGRAAALDTLLVSVDRGATFTEWLEVSEVGGVVIEPNGEVWIGEHGEGSADDSTGLWHATSVLDTPQRVSEDALWCLNLHGDTLEGCDRIDWGTIDRATGRLTTKVSFKTLAAVHSCDDLDVVAMCRRDFCIGRCAHWFEAPLCADTYNATAKTCGGLNHDGTVAGADGAGAGGAMTSGGAGGSTGGLASGGSGGSVVTGGMDAPSQPPEGVVDGGVTPAMKSEGGCACRAVGDARRRGPHRAALLGISVAALLCLRRTRRAGNA